MSVKVQDALYEGDISASFLTDLSECFDWLLLCTVMCV